MSLVSECLSVVHEGSDTVVQGRERGTYLRVWRAPGTRSAAAAPPGRRAGPPSRSSFSVGEETDGEAGKGGVVVA